MGKALSFISMVLLIEAGVMLAAGIIFALREWARQDARKVDAWRDAAAELGLEFSHDPETGSSLSLCGVFRGCRVSVDVMGSLYRTGYLPRKDTRIVALFLKPLEIPDIYLTSRVYLLYPRPGSQQHVWVGSKAIKLGDKRFDRAFSVASTDREAVSRLLGEGRRERILDIRNTFNALTMNKVSITGISFGVLDGTRTIVNSVSKIVELVRAFNESGLPPGDLEPEG